VKFTFERLVDPKNKLRAAFQFAPLSHVEIVDPYTVRLHTKAPWPILDTLRIEWKARGDERIKGYDMAVRSGGDT